MYSGTMPMSCKQRLWQFAKKFEGGSYKQGFDPAVFLLSSTFLFYFFF